MTALSAWALLLVLWLLARRFWHEGVPLAMGAVACFGTAYVMFALQGSLDFGWVLDVGHGAIVLGISLMHACYHHLRHPQRRWAQDWEVVLPPLVLFALVSLALPHNPALQVRLRGGIFVLQMLWQIDLVLHLRRQVPGTGWKLVLLAQIGQLLALLPMLLLGDRPRQPDLVPGAINAGVLLPWVICLVMFLNLQLTAYGYLLILNERQHAREQHAAGLDALTQLPNRRTLMAHVAALQAAPGLAAQSLGVLLLDIDHFKRVNDQYGHLAGDAVLATVAERLRQQLRPQDFVARYGGEEFVLLLPGMSAAEAQAVAQRVAQAVRGGSIAVDEQTLLQVTISIGVHVQPLLPGVRWESLVAAADAALYEAKRSGRDRVVLSQATLAAQPGRWHVTA